MGSVHGVQRRGCTPEENSLGERREGSVQPTQSTDREEATRVDQQGGDAPCGKCGAERVRVYKRNAFKDTFGGLALCSTLVLMRCGHCGSVHCVQEANVQRESV